MPARSAKDILESSQLIRQLEELGKGGYAKTYQASGKTYRSGLDAAIAGLLGSLGLRYETDVPLSQGSKLTADFLVEGRTAIFSRSGLSSAERRTAVDSGKKCLVIYTSADRSDASDPGLRVQVLDRDRDPAAEADGRLQTIFLDDPSFNFDYAHILPKTEKCSVMHGHTSSALVEIVGSPIEGMVVDFNDAKPIIRRAISDLDHKLFISERYVTGRTATHIDLSFSTVHGDFSLHVPRETTVLLQGEATVENLAQEVLRRIAPRMPQNVEAVGVYVYEGLNKGTHLLARLHAKEAEKRRKR